MKRTFHKALCALAVLASLLAATNSTVADTVDPRGVFYHSYTGPFSAIEWIDFRSIDGPNRYQFSDIRGLAPYRGVIDEGQITWDSTGISSGTGMFSDQDNATMTLEYFGDTYNSTLRRAPGTDADFITQIDSRINGNTGMAGQWDLSIRELDPATGDLVNESMTFATIDVFGDVMRMTYEDGTYFQGVFEDPDHAGFRVVLPPSGLTDEFASFEGSETSLALNLLGDFRFSADTDTFAATFPTQTRNAPGQQQQTVFSITAARAVPEPSGVLLAIAGFSLVIARRKER